eukprot:scaffold3370_cov359-Prasinococcus_capsulatus_cf.AAC.4
MCAAQPCSCRFLCTACCAPVRAGRAPALLAAGGTAAPGRPTRALGARERLGRRRPGQVRRDDDGASASFAGRSRARRRQAG